MRQLWIHIGLPNTGAATLDRYAQKNHAYLKAKGVDFLIRPGTENYNDLASNLNLGQYRKARLVSRSIRSLIAESTAETLVLSSADFSQIEPAVLKEHLFLNAEFETRILGYFPRQDRYCESLYLQRMISGGMELGFDQFLKTLDFCGGDYQTLVDNWTSAWPEADFVFRRFDRNLFPNQNATDGFLALLGIDVRDPDLPARSDDHDPPSAVELLTLAKLAARVPDLNAEHVLGGLTLADTVNLSGLGLDQDHAKSILARFKDQNEALRARFFPEDEALFDTSDLDGPPREVATSSFSDEQQTLILELFKATVSHVRGS